MGYILDVYHGDNITNFDAIKEKCDFIILKATQGTTYTDSLVKFRVKKCKEKGIKYWLYCFLNHGNEKAQVEYFLKVCKPLINEMFVGYVIDIEQDNRPANVKQALDVVKATGEKVLLYYSYAYNDWYARFADQKDVRIWEARYSTREAHSNASLWQYTENGRCPGVSGGCDLNRLTGRTPLSWFLTRKKNETSTKKKDTATKTTKTTKTTKKNYSGVFPILPKKGYLEKNDKGTQVLRMQKAINWAINSNMGEDGIFGADTKNHVEEFQKRNGLIKDGIFGEKSLKKLKTIKK